MDKSTSITALAEALSKAQGEMPPAPMGSKNPFLKNKYANLGDIIKTSFPVLARNGLSVSQGVINEGEMVGVETILMHSSGEWLSSKMFSPPGDIEKGVSVIQVLGKTITYLRRYTLSSVLGMYADEDADGATTAEMSGKTTPVTRTTYVQPTAPTTYVPGPFAQKDLVAYAATKHVTAAALSAALRTDPETNPDNWDPKKEALYKAAVDKLSVMP